MLKAESSGSQRIVIYLVSSQLAKVALCVHKAHIFLGLLRFICQC